MSSLYNKVEFEDLQNSDVSCGFWWLLASAREASLLDPISRLLNEKKWWYRTTEWRPAGGVWIVVCGGDEGGGEGKKGEGESHGSN